MSQIQMYTDEKGRTVFNFGAGAPVKAIPGYQYYSKEALLAEERRRKEVAFREKEEARMEALEAPTTKLAGLEDTGAVATSRPVADRPKPGRRRMRRPEEKEAAAEADGGMDIEEDDDDNDNGGMGGVSMGSQVCIPDSVMSAFEI